MELIRRLQVKDLDALSRFLSGEDGAPAYLALELQRPETYLWLALFDAGSGDIIGVHRGMRLGSHLLLKGVVVDQRHKGSTSSLQLGRAMVEAATALGLQGVAAWIEPSKPERHLAERLRLVAQGPLVHRYLVPLQPSLAREGPIHGDLFGTVDLTGDQTDVPLVPSLLPSRPSHYAWVLDGKRIFLGGNPCPRVSALPLALRGIEPLARRVGATSLELALPASDLVSALETLALGARRLSRTPVRLGIRSFSPHSSATRDYGPAAEARC